jgi:hypothetical protein
MSSASLFGYLEWKLGFGDNDVMGWAITIGYFVAALLCFAVGRDARRQGGEEVRLEEVRRERSYIFWYVVAGLLVVLGVNKQLELQILLTQVGRELAEAQGWYDGRRVAQGRFLRGLVAAGGTALVYLGWVIRRDFLRQVGALAGVVALVCFVIIRAASIEHVDQWLGSGVAGGVQVHFVLEFGGIVIIALTALCNLWRRR